jgi:transposase
METREQRGIIIAATVKLTQHNGHQWIVPSQSSGDKKYIVDPEHATCTCPDHQETGFVCKHIHAVMFTIKREQQADGTVVEQRTFTFTEKKVYRQNWPKYNEGQQTEKNRFQEMLFDLCGGIQEPQRAKTGRPRMPISDMVFATTFKIYSTVSARRFSCDLIDAHEKGYISRPMHYNCVCAYLESDELTPILKSLIAQSALPLRAVESDFAVDSSGFSVCRFIRWYDHRNRRERETHDWVKVHLACGVKTNIVTAAVIKERDAADSPLLPELVKETSERFDMKEVTADKGYLSVANVEAIFGVGAVPFIAVKSSTTGGAGGLFQKMVHYYAFNRDQYMAHYHKRSNIESTVSMIKRKFGDYVRSRTETAMRNEVYAKLLAHNLCVVHSSQVELGIEPVFWPERAKEETAILPFRSRV